MEHPAEKPADAEVLEITHIVTAFRVLPGVVLHPVTRAPVPTILLKLQLREVAEEGPATAESTLAFEATLLPAMASAFVAIQAQWGDLSKAMLDQYPQGPLQ